MSYKCRLQIKLAYKRKIYRDRIKFSAVCLNFHFVKTKNFIERKKEKRKLSSDPNCYTASESAALKDATRAKKLAADRLRDDYLEPSKSSNKNRDMNFRQSQAPEVRSLNGQLYGSGRLEDKVP